jgi:hypothetical protein
MCGTHFWQFRGLTSREDNICFGISLNIPVVAADKEP